MIKFLLILFGAYSFSYALMTSGSEPVPSYSILEKHQKITLNPDYSYVTEVYQKTLITDPKGLNHGRFGIVMDRFTTVGDFEAKLINPLNGKIIKKLRLKDLTDRAFISDESLYQDTRLKYFNVETSLLPLQVEVSYTKKTAGNFHFPEWQPHFFPFQKVDRAVLEIHYPEKLGLRYKTQNLPDPLTAETEAGWMHLKWELAEQPPLSDKVDGKDFSKVALAPVRFAMEGYEGNMASWESLGRWFNLLNQGKDDLPQETKTFVHGLVEGITDDYEKIDVIYKYVQKHFRYVSIQLGIGGWMPTLSADVMANKYGDCKALTMLMKAMLKEAGISSDYTLVKAGEDAAPIDTDFPYNQFNHAILRVPLENDIIWIECTSNLHPAGFLGKFTANREVLVLTEDGGIIDKTPSYSESKYRIHSATYNLNMMDSGNAHIEGENYFQGFPAGIYSYMMYAMSDKEKVDYLNGHLGGKGLLVKDHHIELAQQREIPSAKITYSGNVLRFYQSTAKRILIPLSWAKWEINSELSASAWFEDRLRIQHAESLTWEEEPFDRSVEEDYFSLRIVASTVDDAILIHKTLQVNFPEDISSEEKANTISKINDLLNKQLTFKKSN
ncbi:DUF3857 domain-containing transglutaminase family protein [Negadavirga shengliensis]|uniref:DUF3857 domain-containing transglutaminase family protein n=1 Tax=Negadavirga shengliensis TaxID=1389218 RepID=A0ABV9T1F2_9BACT